MKWLELTGIAENYLTVAGLAWRRSNLILFSYGFCLFPRRTVPNSEQSERKDYPPMMTYRRLGSQSKTQKWLCHYYDLISHSYSKARARAVWRWRTTNSPLSVYSFGQVWSTVWSKEHKTSLANRKREENKILSINFCTFPAAIVGESPPLAVTQTSDKIIDIGNFIDLEGATVNSILSCYIVMYESVRV